MRNIIASLVSAVALVAALPHSSPAITLYGAAYADAGPATLYTINSSTGIGTPVGLIGFNQVSGIDFNPLTGILYGIGMVANDNSSFNLITINTTTGLGTSIGATGLNTEFQDISFRSDGTLFGISNGQAYTLNLLSGVATALPNPTGLGNDGSGLAFNLSDVLYNINGEDIGTINQTTGVGTDTGVNVDYPISIGDAAPNALDYDPATGILYASVIHEPFQNFLPQIDVTDGDVDNPVVTVTGLNAIAVPFQANGAAVPEGMSTLWLGLPLLGLFAVRRRTSA